MKKQPCIGPVYIGDQGIERCTKCDECLCCDPKKDHSKAVYECWRDSDGVCLLGDAKLGRPHVCGEDETI